MKTISCLTKHHTMKKYWGSGGTASRIRNFDTRWRWVVCFTPWPLCSWYPLGRRFETEIHNKILVGKPKRKRPLGRTMSEWKDIRTNIKETGW